MSSTRAFSRRRWAAGAASLVWHAAVLALLVVAASIPSPTPPSPPVAIELVAPPPAQPSPTPAPEPQPSPAPARSAQAAPARVHAETRPTPVRIVDRDVPDAIPTGGATSNGLSDAELAGAAVADSGSGGGACDLARRIQAALRRDPLVRSALVQASSDARGRAVMVWNGDWVQSNGEDGKGLAAVREAIMWEVAFSPAPCRAEPVRGLILMSMADGGPRLALGAGQWRWSDLLRAR